jgi:hypothetical protein
VDQGQFSDPDFIKGKMSNLPIKQNIKSSSRNPDSSYISPKLLFFANVRLDLQNCRISIFHLMWFQNITEVNCLF